MNLQQLIREATNKDREFRLKLEYWTIMRRIKPDLDWLFSNLERILGRDYCLDAARKEIDKAKEDQNG